MFVVLGIAMLALGGMTVTTSDHYGLGSDLVQLGWAFVAIAVAVLIAGGCITAINNRHHQRELGRSSRRVVLESVSL